MQKYFRPLLTHDIKGSFISNSDWSAWCYTNALYVPFTAGETFIGWFIFSSLSIVAKDRKTTKYEFPSGAGM